MTEKSEVYQPPKELSLKKLRKLKEQGKRIETEQGIKPAEELLRDVRNVIKRVLRDINLNVEKQVETLPQCLRAVVRNCILAVRKSISESSEPETDEELEEWMERVQKEGFGMW